MTSATVSARLSGISAISIHPVAGSIIVAHHKSTSFLELGCLNLYGPIRSTHSLSHGSASASLAGSWPYLELWVRFVVWHVTHLEQTLRTVVVNPRHQKCCLMVISVLVSPGWHKVLWYHSVSGSCSDSGTTIFPALMPKLTVTILRTVPPPWNFLSLKRLG